MNLKFYDKKPFIYSLFILSVILIVVISTLSWRSTQDLIRRGEWVNHTNRTISEGERIISLLKDAETGQRGYLLTYRSEFLYPFWKARASLHYAYDSLKWLTRNDRQQQRSLVTIRRLMDSKMSHLEHSMELRRTNGLDSAVALINEGEGKKLMDSLRLEISYFQHHERELLKIRTAAFVHSKTYMERMLVGAGGLTLFLLCSAFLLLIRRLKYEEKEKDLLEERVLERTSELAASNEELLVSSEELAQSNEKLRNTNEKLNEATEELQKLLSQKEVLLREVYHRVKNNIGVVSGLLELQLVTTENEEVRDRLKAAQDRIKTVSLIQEKLHKSDNLASINLRLYLQDLVQNLRESYGETTMEIETDIDEIFLQVNTLNPIGLIVNELLTNCFKYAFKGIQDKEIFLSFKKHKDSDNYKLIVRDNGRGFPPNFNPAMSNSLGLQLVSMLAEQIDGKVKIKQECHPGAQVEVKFAQLSVNS